MALRSVKTPLQARVRRPDSQTPGRIQKVDLPTLGSNTLMVYII